MPAVADITANFAYSLVAGGAGGIGTTLGAADTSLYVTAGDGNGKPFPSPTGGQTYRIMLGTITGAHEIAIATGRSGDQLTGLQRGQEGTTAQTWSINTPVEVQFTNAQIARFWSYITNLLKAVYNVLDYGALGDGVTDDGPSFRSAADAARVAGGGTVYAPGGRTYRINSTVTHPVTGGGQQVGLVIGANTTLRGDGPGSTIIKMGSLANQAWHIANYQTISPYSDKNISFQDFTLDGSAGLQAGTVDSQSGIYMIGVYGLTHSNVEAIHVHGTASGGTGPNGTAAEGMHFKLSGCDYVSYDHCRVWSDGVVNTATGFSPNKCNHVSYTNCWAYHLKFGMGFTHWTCFDIKYVNCTSDRNGCDGFHSEVSDGVMYSNCHAGGTTVAFQTALYNATALGNAQMGFHLFQCARAVLSGCVSQTNTLHGLYVTGATGSGASIKVEGGSFTSNTGYGIYFVDQASAVATEIMGKPESGGNTADVRFNASATSMSLRTFMGTPPTVPGTGVNAQNIYGVDMMVYVVGGTVTAIKVDNTTVATATSATLPVTVKVRAGGNIQWTGTVAPTWQWEPMS